MATHLVARSLPYRPSTKSIFFSLLSRSFSSVRASSAVSRPPSLLRALRPISVAVHFASSASVSRFFSTRATTSSLNDPSPNWSNRPPKETILLDGCDFEHWLVVMEKPEGDPTRDDIIDSYIKTLAKVVGSEEEARMKIYSVSTRHYYAFGALVSEELSYKIKELPGVRWVLPDSYLDVKNKDYGGEPFINGQAVPYDPKYHEEWVRNNARANERNRRNDRPRNFDNSRNYERRRENMRRPPMSNPGMQNAQANVAEMPQNNAAPQSNYRIGPPPQPQNNYVGGPPPQNTYGGSPPSQNTYGGSPPSQNTYGGGPPPSQNTYGGGPPPQNTYGGGPPPPPPQNTYGAPPPPQNTYGAPPPPQNTYGATPPPQNTYGAPPPPQNTYGAPPPQQNTYGVPPPLHPGKYPSNNMGGAAPTMGGVPQNNMGGMPQNIGRMPPSQGWPNNNMPESFQNAPQNGGMPPQGAPSNYQSNYGTNSEGGMPGRNAH